MIETPWEKRKTLSDEVQHGQATIKGALERNLHKVIDISPGNLDSSLCFIQSWIFTGRTEAESEAPVLWPSDAKKWLIRKDPDAGKDWRQEEKGPTEDEMIGWHHRLDGHEFEQALGVGNGQEAWHPAVHGVMKSWTGLNSWTELITVMTECNSYLISQCLVLFLSFISCLHSDNLNNLMGLYFPFAIGKYSISISLNRCAAQTQNPFWVFIS